MVSVQNGTIKIVANKRPWLARIRAYTPQAEYDLERDWVRLDGSNQVALAQLEEGIYEYSGYKRGFFLLEAGQIVPIEKQQVVRRLGATLDPQAEKRAELRRLEREMNRWYELDRRNNDGDGMFDWCNERELAVIESLEKRIEALRKELSGTVRP